MPEGRMLKKVITTSQKLAKLKSDSARLFYTWLIPFTDCEGRMRANPYILKGLIFPYLPHSPKRIKSFLEDCHKVGLITLYKNSNEEYLQLEEFHIHQTISRKANGSPKKESKSSIPPCPDELRNNSRLTPELIQNNSAESKVKGSKSKVKGSKKKIIFTDEEKLILKELKEVENFPRDEEKIISYFRRLKKEFPKVDALRVAKEFYPYSLKKPLTKNSNPFLRIRRFFINQIKFNGERDRELRVGQAEKGMETSIIDAKIMHEAYEICREKGIEIDEFYDKAKKVFPIIKTTWEQSDKKPATFIRLVEEAMRG